MEWLPLDMLRLILRLLDPISQAHWSVTCRRMYRQSRRECFRLKDDKDLALLSDAHLQRAVVHLLKYRKRREEWVQIIDLKVQTIPDIEVLPGAWGYLYYYGKRSAASAITMIADMQQHLQQEHVLLRLCSLFAPTAFEVALKPKGLADSLRRTVQALARDGDFDRYDEIRRLKPIEWNESMEAEATNVAFYSRQLRFLFSLEDPAKSQPSDWTHLLNTESPLDWSVVSTHPQRDTIVRTVLSLFPGLDRWRLKFRLYEFCHLYELYPIASELVLAWWIRFPRLRRKVFKAGALFRGPEFLAWCIGTLEFDAHSPLCALCVCCRAPANLDFLFEHDLLVYFPGQRAHSHHADMDKIKVAELVAWIGTHRFPGSWELRNDIMKLI